MTREWLGLPKRMGIKPSNLVTVEVLGEDGKHRMYQSFTVPVEINGNFKNLDEILSWMEEWQADHPGHSCKLNFSSDIIAKHYRKMLIGKKEQSLPAVKITKEGFWEKQEQNLLRLRKAGQEILENR